MSPPQHDLYHLPFRQLKMCNSSLERYTNYTEVQVCLRALRFTIRTRQQCCLLHPVMQLWLHSCKASFPHHHFFPLPSPPSISGLETRPSFYSDSSKIPHPITFHPNIVNLKQIHNFESNLQRKTMETLLHCVSWLILQNKTGNVWKEEWKPLSEKENLQL